MLESYLYNEIIEAGCDEAGRGCLAGPVFAAAVILPKSFKHPVLNDSKKLSLKNRLMLREVIIEEAIAWAVADVDNNTIDQINILNASFLAMHHAVAKLSIQPQHLLIDGNRFKPYPEIPHTCIVKGDSKYASIAAASILAKTFRDEYMDQIAAAFPEYRWSKNKGYGAKAHVEAINKHGLTMYHRRSFHLKSQLRLDL
jgi:ribonuclease HII